MSGYKYTYFHMSPMSILELMIESLNKTGRTVGVENTCSENGTHGMVEPFTCSREYELCGGS